VKNVTVIIARSFIIDNIRIFIISRYVWSSTAVYRSLLPRASGRLRYVKKRPYYTSAVFGHRAGVRSVVTVRVTVVPVKIATRSGRRNSRTSFRYGRISYGSAVPRNDDVSGPTSENTSRVDSPAILDTVPRSSRPRRFIITTTADCRVSRGRITRTVPVQTPPTRRSVREWTRYTRRVG